MTHRTINADRGSWHKPWALLVAALALVPLLGGRSHQTATLQAQTRVTNLQNARNLVINKTDGQNDYLMITPEKPLMFHKQGTVLTVEGNTLNMTDVSTMRITTPQKFALDEDATTYAAADIDHGLVALRYHFNVDKWNALVVPFDLTGPQITEAFGEGTQVALFSSIDEGEVAQVNLTLADLSSAETVIPSGQCLLIRPTREPDVAEGRSTTVVYGDSRVQGPVYLVPSVSTKASTTVVYNETLRSEADNVRLRISGAYYSQSVSGATRTLMWVNDNGFIEQTAETLTMKGFHNWLIESRNTNELPYRFYINGIDEDITATTGISAPAANGTARTATGSYYDLSGRQLSDKPTAKGIYIYNGKKMMVR